MRPSRPAIGFVVAALACCGRTLDHRRPLQRLPPLGRSILVLAPHPDDEVLGAASVIDVLHFANPIEPFAREDATLMPQAMELMRPGVQRTSHRIIIRVPRGPCVADPDASDRLRLRFFGAG